MKVTAFYYHDYANTSPADPANAASRITVEVGSESGSLDHFDATYSFYAVTPRFLRENDLLRGATYRLIGPVMLISRFDDATIREAIEDALPKLSEWAAADTGALLIPLVDPPSQ